MKNKLENLLSFDDFNSNWKSENAKQTKRTQTGLDILKENAEDGIEEIIPAGTLDSDIDSNYGSDEEKIEEIKSFLEDADEDSIDAIVNELRDVLLEMEQQGFVDADKTDQLDDEYDDDWQSWIIAVVELEDFPEEGLNNIMNIINNVKSGDFEFDEEDDDDEEDLNDLDNDGVTDTLDDEDIDDEEDEVASRLS